MSAIETLTAGPAVSGDDLRAAIGHFATGVAVVTTVAPGGELVGTTISAVSSVSLDPPLILIVLDLKSNTLAALRSHGAFTVNVLAADQQTTSNGFARSANAAAWDEVDHRPGHSGSPHLYGASASIECTVEQLLPGGDHEIIVGRVVALNHDHNAEPLVYHRGKYTAIAPLVTDEAPTASALSVVGDQASTDAINDEVQIAAAELEAVEASLPTSDGDFRILAYERADEGFTTALVHGDVTAVDAPLVHAHHACLFGDVFGSLACGCAERLDLARERIREAGAGVIIYTKPAAHDLHCPAGRAVDGPVAAGLLRRVGVHQIRLLEPGWASTAALTDAGILTIAEL